MSAFSFGHSLINSASPDHFVNCWTFVTRFSCLSACLSFIVKSRKPSLGELILRHTNSPTRARHAAQAALAHVRDGSHSLHSALFRGVVAGTGTSSLEKQAEALRVKNTVYCAVIFSEFLKELAALAQEHAVAMPFPPSQDTEEWRTLRSIFLRFLKGIRKEMWG